MIQLLPPAYVNLREGDVFTRVCLSVHKGSQVVGPIQTCSLGDPHHRRTCWKVSSWPLTERHCSLLPTAMEGNLSRGVCQSFCSRERAARAAPPLGGRPPWYWQLVAATPAGGTHTTGMHSCFVLCLDSSVLTFICYMLWINHSGSVLVNYHRTGSNTRCLCTKHFLDVPLQLMVSESRVKVNLY